MLPIYNNLEIIYEQSCHKALDFCQQQAKASHLLSHKDFFTYQIERYLAKDLVLSLGTLKVLSKFRFNHKPVENLLDSLAQLSRPLLFLLLQRLLNNAPSDSHMPDQVENVERIVQEFFVILLASENIVEAGNVRTLKPIIQVILIN